MSNLEVYDTDGMRRYPEGEGSQCPEYDRWATRVYLDVDIDEDGRPVLTVYARVRIDDDTRPVYFRYVSDSGEDPLRELGRTVKRTLVQGANWSVVDIDEADDPGFLFTNLIWIDNPAHPRQVPGPISGRLPSSDSAALRTMLESSENRVVIKCRDFRYAATLLERYLGDVPRIRITVDPDPADSDHLVIHCDETLDSAIELPSAVETELERTEQRLAEEARDEAYDQLEDALARLADLGMPPQTVADRLESATGRDFDGIRVAGPEDPDYERRYREASDRIEELTRRVERLEAELESERQPSSLLDRVFGS